VRSRGEDIGHGPAAELSITLSVLSEAPDAAAAQVVPHSPVGDHTDVEDVLTFAKHCDVVTFDHEHVPPAVLEALVSSGVPLHPTPEALHFAQDKLAMRERLSAIGVACPEWARAATAADVQAFGDRVGWPVVAKTPRGGYDGKGVRVVESADEVADWLEQVGSPGPLLDGVLLEEKVDFVRELAVLIARSPSNQAAAWPVVETVQTDGICTEVLAPRGGDVRGSRPRHGRGVLRRQRARHAPPQQRPLVDGRCGDGPVRAAPAGGPRPAAG
jgi:5-(carboxyamino)imidazole ribonucleotide synthase